MTPARPVPLVRHGVVVTAPARRDGQRTGPAFDARDGRRRSILCPGAPSHVEHFAWAIELTTGQVRDLFTTFSAWSAAEVVEAAGAVDELGGRVLEHYVTPLIVLRRADES